MAQVDDPRYRQRPTPTALPGGPTNPDFLTGPQRIDDTTGDADGQAVVANSTTYEFTHTLGYAVISLLDVGFVSAYLHGHPSVPWRMLVKLKLGGGRTYRWPG